MATCNSGVVRMSCHALAYPLPSLIAAEAIIKNTEHALAEIRSTRDLIARTVQASSACFQNVVKPLIDVENRTQGELAAVAMLRYASPDGAAREASEKAVALMGKCSSEFTAREDMYLLIRAVKDKKEELSPEASKYLEFLLSDFKRCGHGLLDSKGIQEYLEVRNHIENLRRQFNRNIRESKEGIWLSIEELEGVPPSGIQQFTQSILSGQDTTRFVQFRRSQMEVVMKYARKQSTRKKLHVADAHKLPQNVALFDEVLAAREKNARLLGYPSHAAFRLENRVAKTPAWVDKFLDGLEEVLVPGGLCEMNALLEVKRKFLEENGDLVETKPGVMHPWDLAFYRRLAEEAVQVDQTVISEYFPLSTTIPAVLELFGSCLQLRFDAVPDGVLQGSTWHEDVSAWSVWDEREISRGEFVGYLYVDLLARPGKYSGSQNVTLQCGYVKDDGTREYPATVLMCSFPRSTTSQPPLLQHTHLKSLFHELGHGLHELLSKTAYVRFHGHRSPPDYAEIPSMMLERWCWMKPVLKQVSNHFTRLDPTYATQWLRDHGVDELPPLKIPDDAVEALARSESLNKISWYLKQLSLSRFDMAVHNRPSDDHETDTQQSPTDIYNDLTETLQLLSVPDPLDRGHAHADFGHLVSGYDAGYYSYLSALAFAADIFQSKFAADPLSTVEWEVYRKGLLEFGGSRDELGMLEEFLGRGLDASCLIGGLNVVG